MSRYWSPVIHRLTPYTPGEQPRIQNLIKLNTNENPYPPSPEVLKAIAQANAESLRLYPDPESTALKAAIAQRSGLAPSNVFVGNGSDEVLAHVFRALLQVDKPVLMPDVSYSFYPTYCSLYGLRFEQVPLQPDFSLDVEAYIDPRHQPNGGIVIANPNAPTGRLLPLAEIERLLAHNRDSVVVVDEAYIDFGGDSAASLVPRFDNLVVVQTLSKSRSLAGLRVGFALGHADLIAGLERLKSSFNSYPLDRLAQAGAEAALRDEAYFERTREAVINSRQQLVMGLESLGFEVTPSAANFVLARHPDMDAEQLQARLRERGIVVRHFKSPRIDQHLRISVGTHGQCEALLRCLRELVGRAGGEDSAAVY